MALGVRVATASEVSSFCKPDTTETAVAAWVKLDNVRALIYDY